MLFVVLRKMLQNKWLSICLLLGFTLAVATVSSIPMFTRGAAFNEYIKSLRNVQTETGANPGGSLVKEGLTFKSMSNYAGAYMEIDELVNSELNAKIGLPLVSSAKRLITDNRDIYIIKRQNSSQHMSAVSLSKLEDHVNLLTGRMYNPDASGDTIEAVITSADMFAHQLVLNKPYDIKAGRSSSIWDPVEKFKLETKIVIVGVVEPKDVADPYWYYNFTAKGEYPLIYMDQSNLMKLFFSAEPFIDITAEWSSVFDYNKIRITDMDTIEQVSSQWSGYAEQKKISDLKMPIQQMYVKYTESVEILKSIMWLFNILILIILAFYILMISKLIIEFDKNEIALITSRGGGKFHILRGYLIQGLTIGGFALLAGPFLGMLICRTIGASNSFLEFTNRKAIPAVLNFQVYLYSILALLIFLVVMLATSALFSTTSIIEYKQGKARSQNKYLNIRILVSSAMLAFSVYWLYSYKSLAGRTNGVLVNKDNLPIDPLLFLNAALFILGAGLFLTNLFPYVVRLVFSVGRKIWTPAVYTAFVQIGRSAGQEQFLMLFIVLTLSIGVFSANSARTINMNATEKIRYETGADITFVGDWQYQEDKNAPTQKEIREAAMGNQEAALKVEKYRIRDKNGLLTDRYIEPDFKQYTGLSGVESVAKVYTEASANIQSIYKASKSGFMAVNPIDFGKTAWLRPQLMKYHWYEYLNLLADTPQGILLSSSFRKHDIKQGDHLVIRLADRYDVEFIVCDFIDYWPGFVPKKEAKQDEDPDNYLVVANIGYVYNNMPLRPYQVWLKKKPGVPSADIYAEMQEKGIKTDQFEDSDTLNLQMKREPAMLGTNGSLTLGFILTMVISLNGFLIYWVMSLKKRSLQFGIMRAMGIPSKNIIGMLTLEHIMTSGSAIVAGIAAGALASRIFIPVYELFYNSGQKVLPFRIVSQQSDYFKLYALIAVMLLIALSVLFVITKNVKITQAVKLGED